MAWVSIHEEINGPKLRALCRAIKCDKATAIGLLTFLWLWGLRNASRTGEVLHAELEDMAVPLSGLSRYDANFIIQCMVETGWLDVHEDGTVYIHDWEDWQKNWYQYKERLERDKIRKRQARESDGEKASKPEEARTVNPVQSEAVDAGEQMSMKEAKKPYEVPFEEMWKHYPRKDEKQGAYKAYQARRRDGYSDKELCDAVKRYGAECALQHRPKEYIKLGKTFFGPSMAFQDYLPKESHESIEVVPESENPFAEYEVQVWK